MTPLKLKEIEQLRNEKKAEVAQKIKDAVEAICREVEADGVMAVVDVRTSAEPVYGGHSRRVRANVTVDFMIQGTRPYPTYATPQ